MKIEELQSMNIAGVAGVIHKKEITIIASSNLLSAVSRILPSLPSNGYIKILYTSNNQTDRTIMAGVFTYKYQKLGWSVKSVYKRWKVKSDIRRWLNHSNGYPGRLFAFLELYNGCQRFPIGVFSSLEELEMFRKEFYKNGVKNIVIANNEYTKTYIQEKG